MYLPIDALRVQCPLINRPLPINACKACRHFEGLFYEEEGRPPNAIVCQYESERKGAKGGAV